jgi:heat shock protein HslJ
MRRIPERRGRILAAVSVAAAFLLSACTSRGAASTSTHPPSSTPTSSIQPSALVGTWTEPRASEPPFLSLEEDGTFVGSDGCNSLGGTWMSSDDEQVVFGEISSTEIACPGIDTWLSQLASAEVQADVMTVRSMDDTVIGRLEGS